MERQPTLETERLVLRPLAETDREALFAIASDPAVWEQQKIINRNNKKKREEKEEK